MRISQPVSLLDRLGYEAAALGDRIGVDVLRYSRTIFRMYDQLARNDAPAVVAAIRTAFPEARALVDVDAGTGVRGGGIAAGTGRRGARA